MPRRMPGAGHCRAEDAALSGGRGGAIFLEENGPVSSRKLGPGAAQGRYFWISRTAVFSQSLSNRRDEK